MIFSTLIGLVLVGIGFLMLERIFYIREPRPLGRLITPHVLVDFCFCAFNLLAVGAVLAYSVAAIYVAFRHYLPWLDLRLLDGQHMAVQCIVTYVLVDFISYVSHWTRHRIDCLWLFHATHHSQEAMNPLTNLRGHPIDQVVHRMFHVVPAFVLGGEPEFWFWFAGIDSLWGYFVHADVKINLGPLGYLFVSPQYHRIHHSLERQHWNKNFSDRLVVWDYLFRTHYAGADEYPDTGLAAYPVRDDGYHPARIAGSFIGHIVYPFQALFGSIREQFSPRPQPPAEKPITLAETTT